MPKRQQAVGNVTQVSTRIAKSGSFAHGFSIGKKRFSFFLEDPLHPLLNGDVVRFEYVTKTSQSRHKRRYAVADLSTLSFDASERGTDAHGTVYILSNPAMPGLLKVGFTLRDAALRAGELSGATGVPAGFVIEWTLPVEGNPQAVEQAAHARLSGVSAGKEFFRTSLERAKAACLAAYVDVHPIAASRHDEALSARAEKVAADRLARDERLEAWREAEEEKRKAKEWRRSSEGVWRFEGTTLITIEDFDPDTPRGSPPILQRLLGRCNPDYLDIEVELREYRGGRLVWDFRVCGYENGKPFSDVPPAAETLDQLWDVVEGQKKRHAATNRRLRLRIRNANLQNPPPYPSRYLMDARRLVAEIDSVDGLIFIPNPEERRW